MIATIDPTGGLCQVDKDGSMKQLIIVTFVVAASVSVLLVLHFIAIGSIAFA